MVTFLSSHPHKGLSVNDVMAWGVGPRGSIIFNDSAKALVMKSVTMGGGDQNCAELSDVNNGRPLQ